jgi:hypothetical protein
MEASPTVIIEHQEHTDIIHMTWRRRVMSADVYTAFTTINDILEASDHPLYVIVDIRSNPNFPLTATIDGALSGPYRNPKLKEWLILGSNPVARIVERTLRTMAQRRNVVWFSTEAEIEAYLAKAI